MSRDHSCMETGCGPARRAAPGGRGCASPEATSDAAGAQHGGGGPRHSPPRRAGRACGRERRFGLARRATLATCNLRHSGGPVGAGCRSLDSLKRLPRVVDDTVRRTQMVPPVGLAPPRAARSFLPRFAMALEAGASGAAGWLMKKRGATEAHLSRDELESSKSGRGGCPGNRECVPSAQDAVRGSPTRPVR